MTEWLNRYFGITARNSTIATEILAGCSTFLALCYIFVVNPAILSQGGMNRDAVMFATIVVSAAATLTMGLWARLPFALAPGMEMNAYVAFYIIGGLGFTWPQALGAVFWSGILFLLLTVTKIRERIIGAIPEPMKIALAFSVGTFLILIAFRVAGVLEYDGLRLSRFGSLRTPLAAAFVVSLILTLVLDRFRVRAAVLIAILVTTLVCHVFQISIEANQATALPGARYSAIGALDISVLFQPRMLSAVLVLFLIDFFGSIAKLIGLSRNTSLQTNGTVPSLKEALLIDSAATTIGGVLGTSNVTVFVESGVGIGIGGRSGLTAVVCGILMLSCMMLTPYLHLIPVIAASGALVLIGIKLLPDVEELRSTTAVDRIVLVLMPLTVVLTFALDQAMLVGCALYLTSEIWARRRPNPFLVASTTLLAVGVALQLATQL